MGRERKTAIIKTLRHFTPYLKPYRWLLAGCMVFSAAGLAVNLIQAGFLGRLIDAALGSERDQLARYLTFYGLAVAADLLGAFCINYLYGSFSACFLHDFRLSAAEHLERLPHVAMENRHSGDLLSRLSNDLSAVQDFMGGTLLDVFMQMAMLLAAAAYMAWLNWKLLIVSVITVPVALVIVNVLTRNMFGYFRKAGDALGRAGAVVQDALGGILPVKAYGMPAAMAAKDGACGDEEVDYEGTAAKVMRWTPPFNILLRAMPTVFCIGFGSYLIIRGEMSPGQLVAFHFLFGFVQWPLAFLPDMLNRLKRSMGAGERVAEVMDIKPERSGGGDFAGGDTPGGSSPSGGGEAIRFEEVSFSYGEGPPVLQGMSFSLARGERIAIVGASGCGKSTVLKLACGDYETHTGRILVEGHDCREWDLSALRSRLSVISQDVFLFPASILENIAYGRPGASREEIEAAARTANAEEFILKAPQGYETQVGERGIKLSGGQRQRIALARAILKDAPFLLLDEPTSALDTHSEALVQEAIERSLEGRTAIIVAHRLSTIKGVDRILVMDKGRVAEEGPHEALLAAGGLYAALYSRQFNSQEDMGEVPDRGGRDGE